MREPRSTQEELPLIAQAQRGNTQAMEALLAPYQPLLHALTRRFFCAGGQLVPGELAQAGYIGLMQAAMRYDPSRAVRFITYAVPWALGEMRRALQQATGVSGAYEKRREIARQEERMRQSLGRAPRLDELSAACGLSPGEIAQVMALSSPALSVDREEESKEQPSILERLGAEGINVEMIDLRLAIGRLSAEERRLIGLRFFRDRTQQEVAQLLGRSQSYVCKLERRTLDRLRELLA